MSSLIKNLHIKNFKSVRDLSLECDRINIFIGKPNAGKSNILEAISLLGAGYSEFGSKFMEGFIRYKTVAQLFSNLQYRDPIQVRLGEYLATFRSSKIESEFEFLISLLPSENGDFKFKELENLPIIEPAMFQRLVFLDGKNIRGGQNDFPKEIKKYTFQQLGDYVEKGLFLYPPHGENFYLIVRSHKELREDIQQFLKPNGLKLLIDEETKSISIVQETEDSLIRFPLHLVPDTFQRYIFHLAAIMSNRDSVLLFEEPESHSYAPYVYQLAQHILNDEGGNQYFITTHSPYFLLPLMQEGKDVAVFATWFEDYQTHARRLTEEEIREMLDYGVDVFLNLDHFTPA